MLLPVRRALLSVSDKTGLVQLAGELASRNVDLLSTGGTALLVVNFYPFADTVARPDCSYAEAVENIDIGGPAMVRAAAKNHESVLVIVDPADYSVLLEELAAHDGCTTLATRSRFAAKAFAYTARYDTMVASFLGAHHQVQPERFPAILPLVFDKVRDLRY